MDAIFQCNSNYMEEPFRRFDSYMENASLQLRIELEEYVESTIESSGSIFVSESVNDYLTKIKNAIKLLIERLREFIQDTKNNLNKFKADKEFERKLDKLSSIITRDEKLKSIKIKYKDKTPIRKFIKNEKEALKRLVRKPGTKVDELKLFMKRYRESLSKKEKTDIILATVSLGTICFYPFLKGFRDAINDELDEAIDEIKDTENSNIIQFPVKESESTELTKEQIEIYSLYIRFDIEMSNDLVELSKERIKDLESLVSEAETKINEFLKE